MMADPDDTAPDVEPLSTAMQATKVRRLTARQFLNGGYVHEINRLVLHPLGLALEIDPNSTRTKDDRFVIGVWDCRDDPEGISFGPGLLSVEKAELVEEELLARTPARVAALGYCVQPLVAPGGP